MFSVAAGLDVEVGIVARGPGCLDWVALRLLYQLLESIEDRLRNQGALLNPAFCSAGGTHSGEAPITLQDLHTVAVLDHARLAEHRGYSVTKDSLLCGDVSNLLDAVSAP